MNVSRRRGATTLAIVGALSLVSAGPAVAQGADTARAEVSPPGLTRLLSAELRLSGVFDTNVNHNQDDIDSRGYHAGGLVRLRSSVRRPLLTLAYRIQQRSFSGTDRWDRLEHEVRAQLSRRAGPWTFDALGEVDLRVATEDREVGNQYTARPRIAVSFGPARLRAHAAYRLRRFELPVVDPGEGAAARPEEEIYIGGGELRLRAEDVHTFELEYRHEDSRSEDPRRRWIRQRYMAAYEAELGAPGVLGLGLQYRLRRFPDLEAPEDDSDVEAVRRDVRWVPEVTWTVTLPSGPMAELAYEYQRRSSNVPEEAFEAHRVSLSWRVPVRSLVGWGGAGR